MASARTNALAYGIILQAVEIGTAVAMGMPALVREDDLARSAAQDPLRRPVQLREAARSGEAAEAEA